MDRKTGYTVSVNGPVVKAEGLSCCKLREMVMVGEKKLLGELISLEGDRGTIQVYEETEGLRAGEPIFATGAPLSLTLGPGLVGNIFDGIQRPLGKIREISGDFIAEGIGLLPPDKEKLRDVEMLVKEGDSLSEGEVYAQVRETSLILHRLMLPPHLHGRVKKALPSGRYALEEIVAVIEAEGKETPLRLYQMWPVRTPRPVLRRMPIDRLMVTGQRVLDLFFPIAKGGTVALPGGFGTGKTMTQHQLAKWSDADLVIYIGCGERGNEITEVLEDFPRLIDPKSGRPLMERTILIANTSNMPVSAREASVYTGITMAEYFRDMGYHVAIMADSTSRWAEALREISGRLEEMPAEEGYPAYLPSRLAQFYERAGYAKTLCGKEGSVTVIGAVSPPGGDFSEPVTENTKRFVNAFLALDRKLAYARHYPAVGYLTSYSGYRKSLQNWYDENMGEEVAEIRDEMMQLLHEEEKLSSIVQLVGEDVLPDDQRLVLEIARVIKRGILQQNANHKEDTFVPISKQYEMVKIVARLYERADKAVREGIPLSEVRSPELFEEVIKMKYTIPNDDLSGLQTLREEIDAYYDRLELKYSPERRGPIEQ